MKTNTLPRNLLKIFLLVLLSNITLGCPSDKFTIEGKYLTASEKSLKGIDFQLTLQNDNKDTFQYEFKLKDDGSFKINVTEKGIFIGYLSLLNYPRDLWSEPFVSNSNEYYKINTIDNEKIILNNLYISELREINYPKNGNSLFISDDCYISWEADPLASYYHLILVKKKDAENEKTVFVNAFQLKENKISLDTLLDLPVVTNKLDFNEWTGMDAFLRKEGELVPGTYVISVNGYIIDKDQKRYVYTSKSQKNIFQLLSK